MIYKDIVTKKTYIQNGQEKTIWLNVGTFRQSDDGKQFIELNMFPNTALYIFDKKQKSDTGEVPTEQLPNFNEMVDEVTGTSYLDTDGTEKNIPF